MKRGFVIHHDQADHPVYRPDSDHRRCEAFWRAVRNFHVSTKGWSDIAYSFGVCRCGFIFEGRGWHKNQFANGTDNVPPFDGTDAEWYSVLCFLGGPEKPSAEMLASVRNLIVEGRSRGLCGTRVLPHNDFKVKPCPGPELTAFARSINDAPLEDDMTRDQAKKLDYIYNFFATGLNNPDVPGPDDHGGYALLSMNAKVDEILAAIRSISVGGVDYNKLAKAVADEMHRRMAQ